MFMVTTIGASVPSILRNSKTGQIHSIFDKVVNISCCDDQNLLSIYRCDLTPAPTALITTLNASSSWFNYCLTPGMPVEFKEGYIKLPNLLISGIEQAQVWYPAIIRSLNTPDNYPVIRKKIMYLIANIPCNDPVGLQHLIPHLSTIFSDKIMHWENPFLESAFLRMQNLIQSIVKMDFEKVSYHSKTLIGYGPGLTPSGDDFLAGLMCALLLISTACKIPMAMLHVVCKKICAQVNNNTNSISEHFLKYAALGQTNETSEQVILTLLFGSQHDVTTATDNLLQIGSSSGGDQLLGILLGFFLIFETDLYERLRVAIDF